MENKIFYIKSEQKRIAGFVTKNFKKYYLTGGTALSFYFNHRFSEDLDFFSQSCAKEDTDKIMNFIAKLTGFKFKLEAEQDDPKLIPIKVYLLELKKGSILKIDFVQDFKHNLKIIKNGLHSLEDIYYRKMSIGTQTAGKSDITGKEIPSGRQSVKDLFDIYYLSKHYSPLSDFFFEYFSYDKAEGLIAWYRGFNRMDLKVGLMDLVPKVDTGAVIRHLDNEILKKLPEKLI